MPEFAKKHSCMCITLLISFIIILSMFVTVIVVMKGQIINDKVMSEATVIGLSIGTGVLFFIFFFFLVTEVLIKISYKVKLLENSHSSKRKESKHHSISIVDCGWYSIYITFSKLIYRFSKNLYPNYSNQGFIDEISLFKPISIIWYKLYILIDSSSWWILIVQRLKNNDFLIN